MDLTATVHTTVKVEVVSPRSIPEGMNLVQYNAEIRKAAEAKVGSACVWENSVLNSEEGTMTHILRVREGVLA